MYGIWVGSQKQNQKQKEWKKKTVFKEEVGEEPHK